MPTSQATPQSSVHGDFFERNRFLLAFAVLSTLMGTSVGMAKVATSLYALELRAELPGGVELVVRDVHPGSPLVMRADTPSQ